MITSDPLTSPLGTVTETSPDFMPNFLSASIALVAPVPPFSMGSVPDIVEDVSECVWLVLAAPKFERAEDALVAPVPPFVMGTVGKYFSFSFIIVSSSRTMQNV